MEGLQLASELGVKKLAVFRDSELLVKQMKGEYRVKHEDLKPLYDEAKALAAGFEQFTITHVRREKNKRADEIGNDALDGKPRRRGQPPPEDTPARAPTSAGGSSPARPKPSAATVGDGTVRDDALAVLLSAAQVWAAKGVAAVPVAAVWEQLWSVLEDGGVLKKRKK